MCKQSYTRGTHREVASTGEKTGNLFYVVPLYDIISYCQNGHRGIMFYLYGGIKQQVEHTPVPVHKIYKLQSCEPKYGHRGINYLYGGITNGRILSCARRFVVERSFFLTKMLYNKT